MKSELKISSSWFNFIGLILLLIGLFAAGRTLVNMTAFDKYPQSGVLPFGFMSAPPYSQREDDCTYVRTYYDVDGINLRQPSEEERRIEKEDEEKCLRGVKAVRDEAKVNDISQSALFLFLGAGILLLRKVLFK